MIDKCTLRHSRAIPKKHMVKNQDMEVAKEGFVNDELLLVEDVTGSAWGEKQYT